jgi:hypothetical protein
MSALHPEQAFRNGRLVAQWVRGRWSRPDASCQSAFLTN